MNEREKEAKKSKGITQEKMRRELASHKLSVIDSNEVRQWMEEVRKAERGEMKRAAVLPSDE